jgi:serine/threonine protein kinase
MNDHSFEDSASQDGPNLFRSIGLGGSWMYRIRPSTLQAIEELGYQIAPEELGRGASSVVLSGIQPDSGHRVAIKVIVDPDQPAVMQQFERERKVLASKEIPPLVAPAYIHSFYLDNCQPVLIMERVQGERITDYVQRRELGIPERIELLEKLFESLSRLHTCNLIHGDPSPNNVFVDSHGCIRLLDFGNSRRLLAGYQSTLESQSRSGTPSIAPVEQTEGELAPSLHTDVYSAASIAYLVLTGETRLPERTADADAFHRGQLLLHGVPVWFTTILTRMMQRSPSPWTALHPPSSYAKMAEVIADIRQTRGATDAKRQKRRRFSKAALAVVSVLALVTWGLNTMYQNQYDERRIAQNSIRSQIQQALGNLEASGLPSDSGLLLALRAEQKRWKSDELLSLSNREFKLIEIRVQANLLEAMLLDQRLNVALPTLNLMEKCFKSTSWVKSAEQHAENCLQFERELALFRDKINIGITLGIRTECRRLETRLSQLLEANICAAKAETARSAFLAERDILPNQLRRMTEYLDVAALEESAKLAWQNEAYQLASKNYIKAFDAILDFRDQYESEADQAVRAAQLFQKQAESQSLVDLLRSQIDSHEVKTDAEMARLQMELQRVQHDLLATKEVLNWSQNHAAELTSRLLCNFVECDGCEMECQGDWVNGWSTPIDRKFSPPEGVAKVLMEKAMLQEELERTQQRLQTFESILERTLQGPTPAIASASSPSSSQSRIEDSNGNSIPIVGDRETFERPAPSRSQPVTPPTDEPPNPDEPNSTDQPIDLSNWTDRIEPGRLEDGVAPIAADFSNPHAGQLAGLSLAGVPVSLRYCPLCDSGVFLIGSPASETGREVDEIQVPIQFEGGFWIMQTECTQELWNAVMGLPRGDEQTLRLPVTDISFVQCDEFIDRANRLLAQQGEQFGTHRLSLPSEAEWEYACRAGSKTSFCFGDDPTRLADYGWFKTNANGELQPVGTKTPNAWGIHDMHGSVWEWTLSTYALRHNQSSSQWSAALRTSVDSPRVTRGGSIDSQAAFCRSACRSLFPPARYQKAQGFRMIMRPDESIAALGPSR